MWPLDGDLDETGYRPLYPARAPVAEIAALAATR
jgi:hypothetical protein